MAKTKAVHIVGPLIPRNSSNSSSLSTIARSPIADSLSTKTWGQQGFQ